ncbi:MAG: hypothetical protein AAF170_02690 [Bacteroidota bacterium]
MCEPSGLECPQLTIHTAFRAHRNHDVADPCPVSALELVLGGPSGRQLVTWNRHGRRMLLQMRLSPMLRSVLCLLALMLSACAGDDATSTPSEDPAIEDKPEVSTDGPFDPLSPPPQAARPVGSAGAFVMRYIRGTGELADTTTFDGFLPPPIPPEAYGTVLLDAVPIYKAAVKPSSVPDAVNLREAGGYIWMTVDEIGDVKASLRTAASSSPIRFDGLFRGQAYAFTFDPVWTGGAVEPQLWIRDHEKEDIVLGEMPLPVGSAPVWAHPITLPTVPEGTRVSLRMDLEMTQIGLEPVLIFPSTLSSLPWSARQLEVDALTQGRRDRAGETSFGTPYRLFASSLDTSQPTAYLVLVRPE